MLDTAAPHISSVWVDLRIVTGPGAKTPVMAVRATLDPSLLRKSGQQAGRRRGRRASSAVEGDDDIANLVARGHVFKSFSNLFERIPLIYHRREDFPVPPDLLRNAGSPSYLGVGGTRPSFRPATVYRVPETGFETLQKR